MVVMQAEACLEEEKVKSEEYRAVVSKYQERLKEMEVSVRWIKSFSPPFSFHKNILSKVVYQPIFFVVLNIYIQFSHNN